MHTYIHTYIHTPYYHRWIQSCCLSVRQPALKLPYIQACIHTCIHTHPYYHRWILSCCLSVRQPALKLLDSQLTQAGGLNSERVRAVALPSKCTLVLGSLCAALEDSSILVQRCVCVCVSVCMYMHAYVQRCVCVCANLYVRMWYAHKKSITYINVCG